MRYWLLSLVVVFLLALLPTYALAQEVTQEPVIPQQFDPQKLHQLQQTYLSQLEQYRIQQQRFDVAKGQYIQLQTLASQEEAIRNMRELLVLRAQVLSTYIEILEELLKQSLGVPLESKNSEIVTLTLLKEEVQVHKNKVESAFDRLQLDEESKRFEPTYDQIEEHSYYILNMIRTGAMRNASDKLNLLRDAVQSEVNAQTLNATKKAEKERGFQEINRLIDTIHTDISAIEEDIHEKPGIGDTNSYSSTSQALQKPYSSIHQGLEFIREIRKP